MTMGYRYNDGFNSNGIWMEWNGEVQCNEMQCILVVRRRFAGIDRQSKLFNLLPRLLLLSIIGCSHGFGCANISQFVVRSTATLD